jgi:hypothetical protein
MCEMTNENVTENTITTQFAFFLFQNNSIYLAAHEGEGFSLMHAAGRSFRMNGITTTLFINIPEDAFE